MIIDSVSVPKRLSCDCNAMKIEIFSIFSGWLFPVVLPVVHITTLWYFWSEYHFPVDRSTCTCECWDSVFKGPYESGLATYKNFYFNATRNCSKIWLIIATGIIVFYEIMKYLTELLLRGKLRFSMVVLFLSSIFPHYYSWWTFINYLNDDFYVQWEHQLFFTVTEMFSTVIVLYLINIHRELTQIKLMFVMGISAMHLIAGGIDQFVLNVFLMEGSPHQIVRDFGFMVPDVLHIVIPLIEINDLRSWEITTRKWYKDKCFLLQLFVVTLFVSVGCFVVVKL